MTKREITELRRALETLENCGAWTAKMEKGLDILRVMLRDARPKGP